MSELTVTDRDRKEAWKIVYAIEPVVGLDEQRRQATTIALALAAQRERIAAFAEECGETAIAAAIRKGETA